MVRLFRLAGEQAGTGRDIRPVFESPEHYMFGTQQAVFSVTRNRFRNRKQLARKGVENSSEVVVFYRGHRGPSRNLVGEGFSRHLRQKIGKIRPFWRGKVAVYRPNQTSKQLVFDRFSAIENAKFRTNFTNLDALLRPQFSQLRTSNPIFCVIKRSGICPFSAFNSAEFQSFRIGFRCSFSTNFPAKRDVYCGKQRTGLCPSSSPQRTSSELGQPSERRA